MQIHIMFVALVVVQELCRCTLSSTRWLTRAQQVEPTLASAGAVIQDQCGTNLAVGVSDTECTSASLAMLGNWLLMLSTLLRQRHTSRWQSHWAIGDTGLSQALVCHTSSTTRLVSAATPAELAKSREQWQSREVPVCGLHVQRHHSLRSCSLHVQRHHSLRFM